MKKKILILGVVMALVAVLVVPMAALADTTTVTGTVAATPTVSAIDPTAGLYSASPIAVTITGTGFIQGSEEASSVTFSGAGVTATITDVVSATSITASVTITAGAATGARDVIVTIAGKPSTTGTGLFTVTSYITVVAPTGFSLGYMTAGATKTGTTTAGTVASNYSTWSVAAIDEKANATGQMNTQVDGLGTSLTAHFQISKTAVDSGLSDADVGLTYPTQPTTLPFFISQVVAANATAGSYQITITFTGSGS